jgi:hypothetical protein
MNRDWCGEVLVDDIVSILLGRGVRAPWLSVAGGARWCCCERNVLLCRYTDGVLLDGQAVLVDVTGRAMSVLEIWSCLVVAERRIGVALLRMERANYKQHHCVHNRFDAAQFNLLFLNVSWCIGVVAHDH